MVFLIQREGKLENKHLLAHLYYLILLDRIDEAFELFEKVNVKQIRDSKEFEIQYDYINCYLDFFRSNTNYKIARETSLRYLTHPIIEWRRLFIGVANQVAELDGDEMI